MNANNHAGVGLLRSLVFLGSVAAGLFMSSSSAICSEKIVGPVNVCRKPMLAENAAFAASVRPGPDAWKQLAARLIEEAEHCFLAGDIELVEEQVVIVHPSLSIVCSEWSAEADGETVFVAVGPNGVWGSCP